MQFSGLNGSQGLINIIEWKQKAVADIPGAEGFDTDRYFFVQSEYIYQESYELLIII